MIPWWILIGSSFINCLQTVDQFFDLKVPMRPGELKSLFRGIDNAFQVYTKHVVDSLGILFSSYAKCSCIAFVGFLTLTPVLKLKHV